MGIKTLVVLRENHSHEHLIQVNMIPAMRNKKNPTNNQLEHWELESCYIVRYLYGDTPHISKNNTKRKEKKLRNPKKLFQDKQYGGMSKSKYGKNKIK